MEKAAIFELKLPRKWLLFPRVVRISKNFANFAGLYFSYFTTFGHQTLQFSVDSVYTVPDSHGHDIKLDSLKTSAALKKMIALQNWITTNRRKSGNSKYDRKLPELDVVTMRNQHGVNGV